VQRRFEQEARITASLRSPHTVELYDFGVTEDGVFYYVMELLNGIDLGTLVTRFGPLPAARAVHILRQTCLSLEEAHRHGIIHRDVKPSNIFVCRMGTEYDFAKVLDFGLVKTLNAKDEGLTAEGGIMGTPDYMPPEMALGEGSVAAASDLYGVGCVAWWLLTGKRLFETSGAVAMMLAHVRQTPAPLSEKAVHEVPAALERVVMKCLEKNPADRYASAEELEQALAGCIDPGEVWTRERAQKWWLLNAPESLPVADARARSTLTHHVTL